MAKRQNPTYPEPRKWASVVLLVFIALTVFLAQSVTWLNNTVLSQAFFTQTIHEQLTDEGNRQALAETIVNRVFEDKPIAQRVIGDQAVMFVSAILGSDVSTRIIDGVVERGYGFVTRQNREDVVIDLSSIRAPVAALITVAQDRTDNERLDAIDPEAIPTEITLIHEDEWPDYSGLVRAALLGEPLLWMVFFGLTFWYLYLGRRRYTGKVYALGFVLIGVTLFGLIMGPFIPPTLATLAGTISMGMVLESIAEAFLDPFVRQMTITLLLLLVALVIFYYRAPLYRAYQTVRRKVTRRK